MFLKKTCHRCAQKSSESQSNLIRPGTWIRNYGGSSDRLACQRLEPARITFATSFTLDAQARQLQHTTLADEFPPLNSEPSALTLIFSRWFPGAPWRASGDNRCRMSLKHSERRSAPRSLLGGSWELVSMLSVPLLRITLVTKSRDPLSTTIRLCQFSTMYATILF